MLFYETQTQFSQDLLFIGCGIIPQVMVICLHLIKHVPLGFYTIVAQPVCILFVYILLIVGACHEM